ncbi:MAG: hypothetical protein ACP5D0_01025 [Hydrogenovibrio sp.]
MNNLLKMIGVLVVTVVIPLAILLGIWAGFLPQSLQVGIGLAAVVASIVIIVGGNLYLIYSDIKTKRYSK